MVIMIPTRRRRMKKFTLFVLGLLVVSTSAFGAEGATDKLLCRQAGSTAIVECTASNVLALGDVGRGYTVSFAHAAGASNITEVAVTVKDSAGTTVPGFHELTIWRATSAACTTLAANSSGAMVIKSGGAPAAATEVLAAASAGGMSRFQTLISGTGTMQVTDTGKAAIYFCVEINGKVVASRVLA
jgi:hypothetical protein